MRVVRHAEPMTSLDIGAIKSLRRVRGLSANASRIAAGLRIQLEREEPITVRQRHALYAICWRFRRQIPMEVQVQTAIALAEAKTKAEEFRMDNAEPETIRAFRSIDGGKALAKAAGRANPLDDLFPETVAE